MGNLTAKQRAFVDEYLVDLNATQAAIRAGYSPVTADKKAPMWVGKSRERSPYPQIWDAVQAKMDERSRKTEITAETVLRDIVRIGRKAEEAEDYSNALKASELQGKHLKLFSDRLEVSGIPAVALKDFTGGS